MVASLRAGGDLDGAVVVVRVARSQRHEIACRSTDPRGRAVAAWQAYEDGSYLVGVVRSAQSKNGPFRLEFLVAERQEAPPGQAFRRAACSRP